MNISTELEKLITKESKVIALDSLVHTIENLSLEHNNHIFLLIYDYYKNENKKIVPNKIPYNGNKIANNKGVSFSITDLPAPLIRIINQYILYISN